MFLDRNAALGDNGYHEKSLTHLPKVKQERDRFDLLRQAYVGVRYHDDYKITPQELKYLVICVELLREQTETSCEKKMEIFV